MEKETEIPNLGNLLIRKAGASSETDKGKLSFLLKSKNEDNSKDTTAIYLVVFTVIVLIAIFFFYE